MGIMRILDHSGDSTIEWDLADNQAVAEAEAIFDRLSSERKLAFARPVGGRADDATLIRRFDPAADEIVWVRPIQGG